MWEYGKDMKYILWFIIHVYDDNIIFEWEFLARIFYAWLIYLKCNLIYDFLNIVLLLVTLDFEHFCLFIIEHNGEWSMLWWWTEMKAIVDDDDDGDVGDKQKWENEREDGTSFLVIINNNEHYVCNKSTLNEYIESLAFWLATTTTTTMDDDDKVIEKRGRERERERETQVSAANRERHYTFRVLSPACHLITLQYTTQYNKRRLDWFVSSSHAFPLSLLYVCFFACSP